MTFSAHMFYTFIGHAHRITVLRNSPGKEYSSMAKLKGPLFSLGASQKLGDALVFFPWKGIDVVREYVVPSNPQTALQTTQRGYLTAAVTDIHAAQGLPTLPLNATDVAAYALWASVVQSGTTWFNQAVRNWIDQNVAGLSGTTYRDGSVTPGANSLTLAIRSDEFDGASITAANVHYGTSKTALLNTIALVIVPGVFQGTVTIPGLTSGVKYYMQVRPTAAAGWVGANSGIYYGYPT